MMNVDTSEPEVKEEKPVIDNIETKEEEPICDSNVLVKAEGSEEAPDCILKVSEEGDHNPNGTNGADDDSDLKAAFISKSDNSDDLSTSEPYSEEKTDSKINVSKKRTLKNTTLHSNKKSRRNASPDSHSSDTTKSSPNSPPKDGGDSSRRTRFSSNPTFAWKQKQFLASCGVASWDEDNDEEVDAYESESQSVHNDSGVSFESTSKNGEDIAHLNKKAKNTSPRRGRPTKEMAALRNAEVHRRKSGRFVPGNDSASSEKAAKDADMDTFIIDDKDRFCWACHRVDKYHTSIQCVTCPRVYHLRCTRGQAESMEKGNWSCPECTLSLKMESFENQSESMKLISGDEFCSLLTRTVEFLSSLPGAEVFRDPVDLVQFPTYRDFIVNPVHLGKIQANIDKKLYGSTESFIADIKWLYHNSIIFNGVNSSLTTVAKSILVRCKGKMNQLERCVDCFKKSFDISISESFLETCRQPHLLVWAKFKGYPFWPSKVFHWKMDNKNNCIVEVKFFNDYSRAWVPSKSIYLFSKRSPVEVYLVNSKDYKSYQNALVEVQKHINNLQECFGKFVYAPPKTEFNPDNYTEHLKSMLPEYDPVKLQARNTTTVSKSATMSQMIVTEEQDFGSKKPIGPKSYSEKRIKDLQGNSGSDSDVGSPGSGSEKPIKKAKTMAKKGLDIDLISKIKDNLGIKRSVSDSLEMKEISPKHKSNEERSNENKEAPKVKRRLSDPEKDSTLLKKMLLSSSEHIEIIRKYGDKESPEADIKATVSNLSKDSILSSMADKFSSSSDGRKITPRKSNEEDNLNNSKSRVQIEQKAPEIAKTKVKTGGAKLLGTKSKASVQPSTTLQEDFSLKDLLAASLGPSSSKNGISNSQDSSKPSSPDLTDTSLGDLSERPIGLETEAHSLRVNPATFDHEGSATRLFNFSVQQLVPLVSEALSNMMGKLASAGNKDALIQILRLQLEEIQQKHVQEVSSLKHVMNQQFLEYAHTSDIIRKQSEQKWSQKVAELEESLRKEQEKIKAERDSWEMKLTELRTLLKERNSDSPHTETAKKDSD